MERNIPGYQVVEILSQGYDGSVWKYKDMKTDALVAIKIIDPSPTVDVDGQVKVLEELKKNPHENIVKLICASSVGDENPCNYIVFEYAEGGNLLQLVSKMGPLAIDYSRSILKQVALGIDHLHNVVHVLHRDIKLENILFKDTAQTKIVICDLGLSFLKDLSDDVKKGIIACGTTEYISPELWQNQQIGEENDMWSFGIVTYACLTAEFPFRSISAAKVKEKVVERADEKRAHGRSPSETYLARQTDVPIIKAADMLARHASDTIKGGIDWTPFPDEIEYTFARAFIEKLLDPDLGTRMTASDALSHQFLEIHNMDIGPAASKLIPRPAVEFTLAESADHQSHKSQQSRKSHISRHSKSSKPAHSSAPHSRASKPSRTSKPAQSSAHSSAHSPAHSPTHSRRAIYPVTNIPSEKLVNEDVPPTRYEQLHPDDPYGIKMVRWEIDPATFEQFDWRVKVLFFLSCRAGLCRMDGKFKLVPKPGTTVLVRQPSISGLNRRRSNYHSRRSSSTGSLKGTSHPVAPVPPPAPVTPIVEVAEPFPGAGDSRARHVAFSPAGVAPLTGDQHNEKVEDRERTPRPESPAIPVIKVQKPTPAQSVRTVSPPPGSTGSSKKRGLGAKHTSTPPQTPNEKAHASESKEERAGSTSVQNPPEPPEPGQAPLTKDALESLSQRSSADLHSTCETITDSSDRRAGRHRHDKRQSINGSTTKQPETVRKPESVSVKSAQLQRENALDKGATLMTDRGLVRRSVHTKRHSTSNNDSVPKSEPRKPRPPQHVSRRSTKSMPEKRTKEHREVSKRTTQSHTPDKSGKKIQSKSRRVHADNVGSRNIEDHMRVEEARGKGDVRNSDEDKDVGELTEVQEEDEGVEDAEEESDPPDSSRSSSQYERRDPAWDVTYSGGTSAQIEKAKRSSRRLSDKVERVMEKLERDKDKPPHERSPVSTLRLGSSTTGSTVSGGSRYSKHSRKK